MAGAAGPNDSSIACATAAASFIRGSPGSREAIQSRTQCGPSEVPRVSCSKVPSGAPSATRVMPWRRATSRNVWQFST